jgi:DNA-binding MarR family transcriptional regulator
VTITDAGRALLAEVFPGHLAALQGLLLEPLSAQDVHTLADVLGRVREHMRRNPPRSASARRTKAGRESR